MSEDNQAGDMTEETNEDQESAVIRELRSRLKDSEKKIKSFDAEVEAAVESALSEAKRADQASKVVSDLGYPKLGKIVMENVEGDIATVNDEGNLVPSAATLTYLTDNLGLEVDMAREASDSPNVPATADAVADVANLGAQLASATRSGAEANVGKRIAEAATREELAAAAAEAGILQG